jgi:hypothetical protein
MAAVTINNYAAEANPNNIKNRAWAALTGDVTTLLVLASTGSLDVSADPYLLYYNSNRKYGRKPRVRAIRRARRNA